MIKELKDYYYLSGVQLAGEDRLTDAVENLEMAVSLDRKNWKALNMLGLCHYAFGNYSHARQYWNASRNISCDDNPASCYLAGMENDKYTQYENTLKGVLQLVEAGKYKRALKMLNSKEIKKFKDIRCRSIRGLCLYAIGKGKKAGQQWIRVLKMDKSNTSVLKYISMESRHEKELL